MLATTQPEDKFLSTIRSRCQHFSFRAVRFEEILDNCAALRATRKKLRQMMMP